MIKKWFNQTTPFVMIAVIAAVILFYQLIIERGGPEGWRFPLMLKLFFLLVVIVAVDVALKLYCSKTYLIWIIELFLCLGLFYYWIIS